MKLNVVVCFIRIGSCRIYIFILSLTFCISLLQLKERAEKLEYWRMRTKQVEEKVEEKNELLRRQSSVWINEADLEKKILEAIVDGTPL